MHDFRAMAIFAEVIKHQSMQQAAKALGLTVSTVSLAVSKIEQQHGIKLLNRTTRSLSPTNAGEAFYQACLQMLHGAERAHRILEQQKTEIEGTLRIASFTSVSALPIADSLKNLLAQHPALTVEWHVDDSFSNLYRQQIDIAIRGGAHALNDPQLIARKLLETESVLCASPDYLAAAPAIRTPQDLPAQQWIDAAPAEYVFTHAAQGSVRIAPKARMLCNNGLLSKELLLKGFGIAVRARAEFDGEFAQGRLIEILPQWTLPKIPIYLVTLNREQPARVRAAVEALGAALYEYRPQGGSERGRPSESLQNRVFRRPQIGLKSERPSESEV